MGVGSSWPRQAGYSIIIEVAVPKPQIDLSFSRYVAARKGEASARSREGAGLRLRAAT